MKIELWPKFCRLKYTMYLGTRSINSLMKLAKVTRLRRVAVLEFHSLRTSCMCVRVNYIARAPHSDTINNAYTICILFVVAFGASCLRTFGSVFCTHFARKSCSRNIEDHRGENDTFVRLYVTFFRAHKLNLHPLEFLYTRTIRCGL